MISPARRVAARRRVRELPYAEFLEQVLGEEVAAKTQPRGVSTCCPVANSLWGCVGERLPANASLLRSTAVSELVESACSSVGYM